MIDQRKKQVSFFSAFADFFRGFVDFKGYTSITGHWFPVGIIGILFSVCSDKRTLGCRWRYRCSSWTKYPRIKRHNILEISFTCNFGCFSYSDNGEFCALLTWYWIYNKLYNPVNYIVLYSEFISDRYINNFL